MCAYFMTAQNYDVVRIIITALEGLIDYEQQICKLHLAVCTGQSVSRKDEDAFLDLPVETFFSVSLQDRFSLFIQQIHVALKNGEFQKAGYLLKKVDIAKVADSSLQLDFIRSDLIVAIMASNYSKAASLCGHPPFQSLGLFFSTISKYLHGKGDNIQDVSLPFFDQMHFIESSKVYNLLESHQPVLDRLAVYDQINKDLLKAAARHNYILLTKCYTCITRAKFEAVCLSLLGGFDFDPSLFPGLVIDECGKSLKFGDEEHDTCMALQLAFSKLNEIHISIR
jgi:hypothetical protein